MIETNFNYLPLAYRVSIERLDSSGIRARRAALSELRQWCDAYATTYGIDLQSQEHIDYRQSACEIACRRFHFEDAAPFVDIAWIDSNDGCGPVKLSNSIRCF